MPHRSEDLRREYRSESRGKARGESPENTALWEENGTELHRSARGRGEADDRIRGVGG